jgi:hypothetical protein
MYPLILPHIFFAFLFTHNRTAFDNLMLGASRGAEAHLENFWKNVQERGDPRLAGHPMKSRPNWMQQMVPLALHGDAVPVIRVGKKGSRSYDAYSWQSIIARGTTLEIKHLVFGIFEDNKSDEAMKTFWNVIVWSFYFLYLGIWPTVDWNGNPFPEGSPEAFLAGTLLANGFCGVLWLLKGDFEHFAKNLYARSYRSNLMCEWCPADQGKHQANFRLWPNYFESDAAWMAGLFSIDEWATLHVLHQIFALGFLSHHNLEPDELHVIYLGIAHYFLGSILALLCYVILPNRPEDNMTVVWTCILQHYSALNVPTQFSSLNLNMIFADLRNGWGENYPQLKGGKGG